MTFASTFGISNSINLLILLILGIVLLFYMTLVQPYKSTTILLLQSSFLINLTILSGFDIFAYTQPNKQALKEVAFGVSTGIVFVQFVRLFSTQWLDHDALVEGNRLEKGVMIAMEMQSQWQPLPSIAIQSVYVIPFLKNCRNCSLMILRT